MELPPVIAIEPQAIPLMMGGTQIDVTDKVKHAAFRFAYLLILRSCPPAVVAGNLIAVFGDSKLLTYDECGTVASVACSFVMMPNEGRA